MNYKGPAIIMTRSSFSVSDDFIMQWKEGADFDEDECKDGTYGYAFMRLRGFHSPG